MIETQKHIRKPLYVDAVRVTAGNFDEIAAWCQGEVQQDEVPSQGMRKQYIKVRVHNPKNPRQTKAFVGDWLLYTERGYKVYTNKAFHASFDVAPAEQDAAAVTPPVPIEEKLPVDDSPEFKEQVQEVLERAQGREVEEYPSETTIGGTPREDINVGEPITEVVPATPEGIAEAVRENEQARAPSEPTVHDNKYVLSLEEQDKMDQEEIRELLKSGEWILAQDLAA